MAKSQKVRASGSSKSIAFVIIGVVTLVAVSLLLMNVSSFSLLNPKASALTPKLSRRYTDNFKSETINEDFWKTSKVTKGDATKIAIKTTTLDNLAMVLPADKDSSWAGLLMKDPVKDLDDFRLDAVIYRPQVTGAGTARVGIQFRSAGDENDEVAGLFWRATSGSSADEIVFYVNGGGGKRRITQTVKMESKSAVLRLVRVNKTYVAYFKNGTDLTGDSPWQLVGQCTETKDCNKGLGKGGTLLLQSYNGEDKDKYPQVITRIDTAIVAWEDASYTPPAKASFSDAFANQTVSKLWKQNVSDGAKITETKGENLVFSIPDTNTSSKVGYARVRRTSPTVGIEKDFSYTATVYKPTVKSAGAGFGGISFVSASNENKESASLRWIVTENASYLSFSVVDRKGTSVEKARKDISASRVTLRLSRFGTKYRAFYRTGNDGDSAWINVGDVAEEETLGESGVFIISASNLGVKVDGKEKFPAVVFRVDSAYGNVEK